MSLDVLFEDVFRNGCGISRERALQSARYRELVETVPHVTHTTAREVAEMTFLGESLADRAFLNLPKYYREQAKKWPEQSAEEHQVTLDMIMQEFTSGSWRKKLKSRHQESRVSVECVLPHHYGSWQRGAVQPNCLGLAQMMVGFARATGERFCLADTIFQFELPTMQHMYVTLQSWENQLEAFPESKLIQKKKERVARYRSKILRDLTEPGPDGHHSLVLRCDGAWLVIDPYLSRRYPLRVTKRYDAVIECMDRNSPRSYITYETRRTETRVTYIKQAVTLVADALQTAKSSGECGDFYKVMYDAAFELTQAKPDRGVDLALDLVNLILSNVVLCRIPIHQLKMYDDEELKGILDQFNARTQSSPKSYEFALRRLLVCVVHQALIALYDLELDPTTEHPVIELHSAAYHLAVMTLNHRAGQLGLPAAELVRFGAGQFLLRDILAEVRRSDNAKHQTILSTRLRALASHDADSIVMPEIRAHIPMPKEA